MKNPDLKEIKNRISKIKHPRINKILESDKIDSLITKIQHLYLLVSNKLIVKYNLEDEIKQGKIFTILFALLTFILFIVITVFFTVTIHSVIGIGLIFSVLRQIIFCISWGYTIVKNKGKSIKKYLANLFPNSKILKEVKVRKKIPLYEENILYQVLDFLEKLDKVEFSLEIKKQITNKLKEIINILNIDNLEFKNEINTLELKRDIAKRLQEVYTIYEVNLNKIIRQNDFLSLKKEVIEQINEVENEVYVKKLKR